MFQLKRQTFKHTWYMKSLQIPLGDFAWSHCTRHLQSPRYYSHSGICSRPCGGMRSGASFRIYPTTSLTKFTFLVSNPLNLSISTPSGCTPFNQISPPSLSIWWEFSNNWSKKVEHSQELTFTFHNCLKRVDWCPCLLIFILWRANLLWRADLRGQKN